MKVEDIYKPATERQYLKVGDRFTAIENEYIIGTPEAGYVVAINIKTGHRLSDHVYVGCMDRLTLPEAKQLTSNREITVTRWAV